MTPPDDQANDDTAAIGMTVDAPEPLSMALLRLARPKHWAKSGFVAVGPFFGGAFSVQEITAVGLAMAAFALGSSGCYVVNDLRDAQADRLHPRKRKRPIASGRITPPTARAFAAALWTASLICTAGVTVLLGPAHAAALGLFLLLYILNVTAYSMGLKHVPVLDVMGLALGFVLRVLGGCAAVGVMPSTWLLNVTLFLSMFLAFGKRLGERRTLGDDAPAARTVQSVYTDDLLRMMVVVTAVALLLTFAAYVQDNESRFYWIAGGSSLGIGKTPQLGMNLLWITMLPATFAVLRSIVLLERGDYDDPTELATRDRGFILSAGIFAALMVGLVLWAGPAHKPDTPPAAMGAHLGDGHARAHADLG